MRPTVNHPLSAESNSSTSSSGSIRGRILLPDGTPLNQSLKVTLQTARGNEVDIYTDFQGQFEFKGVPTGNYQLEVESDQRHFEAATQGVQVFRGLPSIVTISLREKRAASASTAATDKVVSVQELDKNIPREARREFERAMKAAAAGKSEEAISHLRKAVAVYPDYMQAHNDLGAQLLDAGRLDEAAAELRTAGKLAPQAYNPHLNLGIVLLKQQQFAAAAQVLTQALALEPQAPAAQLYAGIAHLALKDLVPAEKELQLASAAGGPESALAFFHLGQLYLDKGKRELALQSFEAYLREMPDAANAEQVRKLIGTLR